MKTMGKTYNPKEFEDRIYNNWETSGAFSADVDPNKEPFTIVMPPPNITGQLHMGHALDQTLQDILIRYKRMKGYSALWVPGSDHASIATEVKVADKIRQELGKDKHEIGREQFLEYAWEWKKEYGGRITRQCRKLGDSCDWSRERFTMDEGCSHAVTKLFVKMYEEGLIYKGKRLINWCPSCLTTLSDAEVNHEDVDGHYWYVEYQGPDNSYSITIATSRPETIFADVAIAVSDQDARYKDLIGKTVIIPIVGREIPIISDEHADPEKGTGAVKITPAHDMNDFEVGRRHSLREDLSCIDENGIMNELAGEYQGLDRLECRAKFTKALEESGHLVKVQDLSIPVGKCYRCNTIIEPRISDQWFVSMETLAKPAIDAVNNGDLIIIPSRFKKIYLGWLQDIRDWCISRQLWWGHRIPAYYCDDCGEMFVQAKPLTECPVCGKSHIRQDEDVLDTWFSSALWPFSTLGWPDKTAELEYFYPNSVLVTAYDILFFWVVRMVFSGLYTMGEVPFKYVFFHGLVRDEEGRKMSKSLGNGIDPLEVIDEVGADALRFMLATGITIGNDMRFIRARLEASRNFANKLWNASRFCLMNMPEDINELTTDIEKLKSSLKQEDKWIISVINDASNYISDSIDKYEIGLAGQKIYDIIWDDFCDFYIEMAKPRLYGEDKEQKNQVLSVLLYCLNNLLKLLHPFMPFITEEIWGYLPGHEVATSKESMLISSTWPEYREELEFADAVKTLELAREFIRAVRNIRTELNVPLGKMIEVEIFAENDNPILKCIVPYIKTLSHVSDVVIHIGETAPIDGVVSQNINNNILIVRMDSLFDKSQEIARLSKEELRLEAEVKRAEAKLNNPGFTAKAPKELIEQERGKLAKYCKMLEETKSRLKALEA